jgi:hypothetical protein
LVRIAYFESEKKQECFDTVISAIDEIAKEEVIGFGTISSDLEQFNEIEELAMDITTNLS